MIHHLLWRCPLCAAHDALIHRGRWLLADSVDCRSCAARWQVTRRPGDNYYLRLTRPPRHMPHLQDTEKSITAWYTDMKTGLSLQPVANPPAWIEPGESLFLASQAAELWETPPGAPIENEGVDACTDLGRLFLTSRRLVWRGEKQTWELRLDRLLSLSTLLNWGIMAAVLPPDQPGTPRLVIWRFLSESPLKWVTHLALLAPQIQQASGHQIRTSHF